MRIGGMVCLFLAGFFSSVGAVLAQSVVDTSTPITGDLVNNAGGTVVLDFSSGQSLSITGDLKNSGTIYAVTSNAAVTTGTVTSTNVYNYAGANITSIVPVGGIPGVPNIYSSIANLVFNASSSFSNEGMIAAAQNLSVVSPTVVNAPFSGALGANPVMQAAQNVNINAITSLTNQGSIASTLANINVVTQYLINNAGVMQAASNLSVSGVAGSGLAVDNIGGSFSAGNILSFVSPETNLDISDGVLTGRTISMSSSGAGSYIGAYVKQFDGPVRASAEEVYLGSTTGDIVLQNVSSTTALDVRAGDNLDISGLFANGPTFANTGGDIYLSAGKNVVASTAANGLIFEEVTTRKQDVSITAGSRGTGGDIFLPQVRIQINGGDVSLTSSSGPDAPGNISIGQVDVSGNLFENAGNINIVAGGDVRTGGLFANGGNWCNCSPIIPTADMLGKGGNIAVTAFGQSMLAPAGNVVIAGNVNISGGIYAPPDGALLFGKIGTIKVQAGSFAMTGLIYAEGGGGPSILGGIPRPSEGGTGGSCPITIPGGGGCTLPNIAGIATQPTTGGQSSGSAFQQTVTPTLGLGALTSEVSVISLNGNNGTNGGNNLFNGNTATIQAKEGQVSRLVLPGEDPNQDKGGHKIKDIIKLAPGDKMTFSAADLADEELIPEGGVDEAIGGGQIAKVTQAPKVVHALVMDGFQPNEHVQSQPIRKRFVDVRNRPEYTGMLKSEGANVHKSGSLVALRSGSVFLHATGTNHVVHGHSNVVVNVAKNAAAQLESEPGVLRIKAISGPDKVTVIVANRTITVQAGQELLVTTHRPSLSEVFPTDGIGRRQLLAIGLDDKMTAILCDYSMIGMLANHGHLHTLRHPVTAGEKSMKTHILKMAAALDMTTKHHGPFYTSNPKTGARSIPLTAFRSAPNRNELISWLH